VLLKNIKPDGKNLRFLSIIFCALCFYHFSFAENAHSNSGQQAPLLMAHYMPWYQTPDVSGYWGWHWTMNHFNPETTDDTGRRDIASHYYPVTGPYDSMDDDILEYQTLLMKLCGINGVIVDWYGNDNYNDYGALNQATGKLFTWCQKAGLLFSLCYEDRTIKIMVENGYIPKSQAITKAQQAFQYVQANWLIDDTFLRINNRPVFLVFGPEYFTSSVDWSTIFSVLPNSPLFFTLDNRLSPIATGAYPWPPMWASKNGILSRTDLDNYLTMFYNRAASWELLVAGAFPGFNDIYKQAGVSAGYGFLDAASGNTLKNTLDKALQNDPDIIQLVTWNDYGEGTIIEPTREFGYQYLEIIQQRKKAVIDTTFSGIPADLELPLQIYNIRKVYKNNPTIQSRLDVIVNLLYNAQTDSATGLLDAIFASATQQNDIYIKNYPNPFLKHTTITFKISNPAWVNLTVYNILGRQVAILLDSHQETGTHFVEWNTTDLPSGVYFIKMKAGNSVQVSKCLHLF